MDEDLVIEWDLLMFACQTALRDQPAETARDDQRRGRTMKFFWSSSFLMMPSPKLVPLPKEPAHALHALFQLTRVAAVGKEHQKAHDAVAKQAHRKPCSPAILNAAGRDHSAHKQTVRVGENMTLAPLIILQASQPQLRGGTCPL